MGRSIRGNWRRQNPRSGDRCIPQRRDFRRGDVCGCSSESLWGGAAKPIAANPVGLLRSAYGGQVYTYRCYERKVVCSRPEPSYHSLAYDRYLGIQSYATGGSVQ